MTVFSSVRRRFMTLWVTRCSCHISLLHCTFKWQQGTKTGEHRNARGHYLHGVMPPTRVSTTVGECCGSSCGCSGAMPTPVRGEPVTNVTQTSCGDTTWSATCGLRVRGWLHPRCFTITWRVQIQRCLLARQALA